MMIMSLTIILELVLLATVVNGVKVSTLTDCNPCNILRVLFPSDTEYLLETGDNKVWYSSDEGQTWKLTLQNMNYYEAYDSEPRSIVFILNDGSMYGSRDGGNSTALISSGFRVYNIVLHPTRPGWLLSYYCSTSCDIYYSKDYGLNWQSQPVFVNYITWGHNSNNSDTIFAITGNRTFAYSNDYGASWTSLLQDCIGLVSTDHYLYVGVLNDPSNSARGIKLYSSSSRLDPTHTLPQYYWLDEFPTTGPLQLGYSMLDDSTRSEFVGVHINPTWGRIYSSDFDGDQFTLSLDLVATSNLYFDFEKVEGLKGMYIANSYNTPNTTVKRTKITYDNGGEWKLLIAPQLDYYNRQTNCNIGQGCSLHLHGQVSWLFGATPPVYSSPNAIGLLIANGNLGSGLSTSITSLSTWFSRDAGVSWTQLYPEPTVYEFADHGGILIFAPISKQTNVIFYSFDEGKTIANATFASNPIFVNNIFTEPTGTGRKFVLDGYLGSTKFIFGLDFTDVTLPVCTDADYEIFIPTNDAEIDSQCFMGALTTYQRRKQGSQCYNNRDTDHILTQVPCYCGWEDYECDVGFTPSYRNSSDGFTCTSNSAVPACVTGYRLIPDTMCNLTWGVDITSKSCPGYSGTPGEPAAVTSSSSTTSATNVSTSSSVSITTSATPTSTISDSISASDSGSTSTISTTSTTTVSTTTSTTSTTTTSTIGSTTSATSTTTNDPTPAPPGGSTSTSSSIGSTSDKTTSGTPTQAPTTGSGSKKDSSDHSGLIAVLVIGPVLFILGVAVGVLYTKNEWFRAWLLHKVRRPSSGNYGRLNQTEDDFGDDA